MPNISTPISIGKMELPHRYYFAPAGTLTAAVNGEVTERATANIEAIARGMSGGLVTWALWSISRLGRAFTSLFSIENDDFTRGMGNAIERVHLAGAKVAPMIFHGGSLCKGSTTGMGYSVSSSNMASFFDPNTEIRELSEKEITEVINQYAAAAFRCKQADCDAIYLHACHGSLIQQFHSPFLNKRNDRWGKDLTLFGKEIVAEIKSRVGSDFPLIMRISVDEFMPGGVGYDTDYGVNVLASEYVLTGIDALCVSAGRLGLESGERTVPSIYRPYGVNLGLAARVKEKIKDIRNIPIMHAGKFFDHKLSEKVISDGTIDMVGLCRPVIADPDVVKKRLLGKFDEERKCICCNMCTTTIGLLEHGASKCAVNSQYCREVENKDQPAKEPRKVMVIGGGVAGMEAARILGRRGHKVTLFEKEDVLGGLAEIAASIPKLNTSSTRNIIKYLTKQMDKIGIEVHVNTEVKKEMMDEFISKNAFDAYIVATGSIPYIPDIKGIRKDIVVIYDDYLKRKNIITGNNVAVIGAQEGAEIAASLAKEEKSVYLIDETNSIAEAPYLSDWLRKIVLMDYLKVDNIKRFPEVTIEEILDDGIILISKDGNRIKIAVDKVILAYGRVKVNKIYELYRRRVSSIYLVGDARMPQSIGEAIHAAGWAARDI